MKSSYLLFLLAGRLFGARLIGALEIMPWRTSRWVPLSYSYVEGLLDYRGTIYPVYNLARRLGLAPFAAVTAENGPTGKDRSIILLEESKLPFGIVVDGVARMAMLEEPTAAPEKVRGIDPHYVKGFTYEEDREIMILDFERLLHAG